jgi:hypothetical protein
MSLTILMARPLLALNRLLPDPRLRPGCDQPDEPKVGVRSGRDAARRRTRCSRARLYLRMWHGC